MLLQLPNLIPILALDCAKRTGFAAYTRQHAVRSGYRDFASRRGSGNGVIFHEFRGWLLNRLDEYQPEVVVYELAHHRGGAATELGVGFAAIVQEAATARSLAYRGIHTATLKLWAAGHGKADKAAMLAAANAQFAAAEVPLITDDNEGDAVCMLAWGLSGFPVVEPAKRAKRTRRG